jgi:hypothetical protein
MEKHRTIGIEGQRDCGMERKTKRWRDRRMEKHRNIGIGGQRVSGVEGQGNEETQGRRD